MPTNLYGPYDNFNIETGHVLPALINRMVSAAQNGQKNVTLWGSGMAKREFLHARDLAAAVELSIERYDSDLHLNVGTSKDLTIKELAELIARLSGFSGDILWDSTKPDGTPRKILDSSRIEALGWHAQIDLESGIKDTIEWFNSNHRYEK
jgi:GDP-L-fucose synthase